MKQILLFLGILFFTGCLPEKSSEKTEISFAKESIRILRRDQSAIVFTVEIADTNAKRERGFMYRTDIRDDEGMLFLFPVNRKASMWMANTPESLDMLFVDEYGRITEIVENAVPFSRDLIQSRESVKAVLELKGGAAKRSGIAPGDRVEHSFFNLEKASENR